MGKPAAFYNGNPVFHAKLTLFVLIALLSIYPTVFLLRQRKGVQETIEVPAGVIRYCASSCCCLPSFPCSRF
ncbi:MAG: DUF2214 family protein [Gammaproteobacteria bacterium]